GRRGGFGGGCPVRGLAWGAAPPPPRWGGGGGGGGGASTGARLADRPPHPNPLPLKKGERERRHRAKTSPATTPHAPPPCAGASRSPPRRRRGPGRTRCGPRRRARRSVFPARGR